jgi:HptB-dependent secretion and biofilm anti anti-sigma factor
MNFNTSQNGGATVIALDGRFTFSVHTAFRELLVKHIESMSSGGSVTFDLSRTEFVDSAALGMLLLAREAANRRSGRIIIRGAVGQVRRMLDVSQFNTLFTIEA